MPNASGSTDTKNHRAFGKILRANAARFHAALHVSNETRGNIKLQDFIHRLQTGNGKRVFNLAVIEQIMPARGIHRQTPGRCLGQNIAVQRVICLRGFSSNFLICRFARQHEVGDGLFVTPGLIQRPAQFQRHFHIIRIKLVRFGQIADSVVRITQRETFHAHVARIHVRGGTAAHRHRGRLCGFTCLNPFQRIQLVASVLISRRNGQNLLKLINGIAVVMHRYV